MRSHLAFVSRHGLALIDRRLYLSQRLYLFWPRRGSALPHNRSTQKGFSRLKEICGDRFIY